MCLFSSSWPFFFFRKNFSASSLTGMWILDRNRGTKYITYTNFRITYWIVVVTAFQLTCRSLFLFLFSIFLGSCFFFVSQRWLYLQADYNDQLYLRYDTNGMDDEILKWLSQLCNLLLFGALTHSPFTSWTEYHYFLCKSLPTNNLVRIFN